MQIKKIIEALMARKRIFLCLAMIGVLVLSVAFPDCAFANGALNTAFDPNFGTPQPPNELFPQIPQHVFVSTSIMFAIAVFFMIIAGIDSFKFKSTVPVGMVLASAFCVVPEVIDNYLGGVYWSQSHVPSDIVFTLLGREFDWYVVVMWWAFGAILGYLLYAVLLRKVKTRTLWICLGLSAIADIIVEELLLNYGGIYTYFGNQPMILFSKFPCWWMFANVSALFISVAIAYRFRHWFNGWRTVFLMFLMPFCYIGGWELCGMPVIFAINGAFTPLVTQLLGVFTAIVAIIQTGATMYLVLGRNPFEKGQAAAQSIPMASSNAESTRKY